MNIKSILTSISPSVGRFGIRKAATALAISGVLLQASAQTWQSNIVKFGSNGKLTYIPDANNNVVPDFSYAGYRNNDRAVPEVTRVLSTLTPRAGDNTSYINNAIAATASITPDANGIRGVILLAKGTYQIAGTIRLNVSGVILRGAGSSADPNTSTIFQATGNTPNQRTVLVAGGGSGGWNKTGSYQANITDNFVRVGSREFNVATTSGLQVGDAIVIYSPCTSAWVNAVGGGGTAGDPWWTAGEVPLTFYRTVKAISGNKVTIDAPVFNHLNKSLAQAYIYKANTSGVKTEIGLENFRIDIRNWSNQDADEGHAWNAVGFVQAEDSWAKNVVTLHFGQAGFRFNTSSRITVDNCKALEPVSIIDGSRRYNFNFEDNCTSILIKNCEANKARHAYTSNGTSSVSGVVVLRSIARDNYTSSEGHRKWSMGMLFDNMSTPGFVPGDGRVLGMYSRGDYGTSHGWSNAHSVAWNCNLGNGSVTVQQPPTAQNYVIGGFGKVNTSVPFGQYARGYVEGFNRAGTISPQSLFEQQLRDRQTTTNIAPTASITAPVQNQIFTAPATVAISATASDADGTISKVEFLSGTTVLNTDATAPYSFDWTNVAAGTYSITVKAYDNAGATGTSLPVSITIQALPACVPVSASGDDGNIPANVLDNNLTSRWSANGDGQWIQFCLDNATTVSGIQIAFYSGNVRQSIFDIQTSANGLAWTNAATGIRSSGTSTALESFTFPARVAKFIRIVGHGNSVNTWNSYTEVKIGAGIPVNSVPTVSISSPANNASFVTPANITINANASDADGQITKVEFYNGTTLLGTDVSAPYSVAWSAVPIGTYSITAKATDDSSAVVTSSAVTVVVTAVPVNQVPTVQITSPSNNASFNAPATISIAAAAADVDGLVSKVEFFNGATKLGEDLVAPYTYTWVNVGVGNYSIKAKATDNEGATNTSAAIAVRVNTSSDLCASLPQYVENGGYSAGTIVKNGGSRYQCKPYPYSGWCNGSAWAYGAGTGAYWTDAWTLLGSCTGARTADDEQTVDMDALLSNAPNPFSGKTTITVDVKEPGMVSLKVFDVNGIEISTLANEYLEAGNYSFEFDATNQKSNVFWIRYNSEQHSSVRKIFNLQ